MAKCDVCAGQADAHKMAQLLPQFRSPGIVDVCPSCEKWATARKFELIDAAHDQLKREIAGRSVNPRPSWLARLHYKLWSIF